MPIFAQTRNFVFKVGDLDLSNNLLRFTLNRGQAEFGSPKAWSGSFDLIATAAVPASELNDLTNPDRWRRGLSVVTLEIFFVDEFLPVFTGYIDTYRFNPNPGALTGSGTLFDVLGLVQLAKKPSQVIKDGVSTTGTGSLITQLLTSAGSDATGTNFLVPEIVLPDFVGSFNSPVTTQDPLIDAQKLTEVHGRWLYLDFADNKVKTRLLDFGLVPVLTAELDSLITFEPDLTLGDYAYSRVIVSGSREVALPVVPGVAGEPDPDPNPDLGTDGGARDRPTRIVTTEIKVIGELTGTFKISDPLNGGFEPSTEVTSTKTIEYTYNDAGDVTQTVTTLEQPLGVVTGTFELGGKNGSLEPLTYLVETVITETLTSRTVARPRGAITGSFNSTDDVNGGLEVTTIITSSETVENFTDTELSRLRDRENDQAPDLKFTDSEGNERNLYEKEDLPRPENTIESVTFSCSRDINLGYTPFFQLTDNRQFDWIWDESMACTLAELIGRLEVARTRAFVVEMPIPLEYAQAPVPFLTCTLGGVGYLIDGEQIELQQNKMTLIFTALPL